MHTPVPDDAAGRSARRAWIMFDWAAQPFFTLVTTFVFAPYVASALSPDPVRGQALWGAAAAGAGLAIALLSPVLGSIADAAGRRKPWIAAFSALLVGGAGALWFAAPGAPNALTIALVGFAVGTIGAEFATVFNNAMLPSLAPPERLGRLSGTGWAMGYAGGLVSLFITLGLLAADPASGRTLLGFEPLFGLDAAAREGDRIAGPLSALWYTVFVLPMFLLVPDTPRAMPLRRAVGAGLRELRDTLRALCQEGNAARFLLGNMVAADMLGALFAFGGIYAAGSFGWGTIEIGIFGILLTVAGTAGALLGGRVDERIGPRRVILGSLLLLGLAGAAILAIEPDRVLGIAVTPPVEGDGLYASTPERLYLALGLVIGAAAGPLQAASRTLLTRLAPAERMGQYFGLLALSGKATAFVGPALVSAATVASGGQRAGMAVLAAGFILAALVMRGVVEPAAQR